MGKEIIKSIIIAVSVSAITIFGASYVNIQLQKQKQSIIEKEITELKGELKDFKNELKDDIEKASGSNGVLFGKISNIEGKLEIILMEISK